jgi:HAD superfamily hydrolase (TIGR01509 family)
MELSAVETVVFDVDDTLVHTHRVGLRKSQLAARALGLEPPGEEAFVAIFGRLSFEECIRVWHPAVSVARYAEVYDEQARVVPYEPVEGARETLEALLRRNVRVGVLTNGNARKTTAKLEAVGVAGSRLDFVCHADNQLSPKPDPAAFARLVAEHGVDPCATVYVTDYPDDCRASATVGIASVGVLTGIWARDDFVAAGVRPEWVLPSVAGLLAEGGLGNLLGRPAGVA